MKKVIEFPFLNVAYYFASRHPRRIYNFFEIGELEDTSKVLLVYDDDDVDEKELKLDLLSPLNAKKKDYKNEYKDVKKDITEYSKIIKLEKTEKETLSSSYLIIPEENASRMEIGELIGQLCNQDDYIVNVVKVSKPKKDEESGKSKLDEHNSKYIFKLDSQNGQITQAPLSLATNPQILYKVTESIYMPYGYIMPLLPNYSDFIPPDPSYENPIQLWLLDEHGEYRYIEYVTDDLDDAKPLSNKITPLNKPSGSIPQIGIDNENLKVTLSLIKRKSKEQQNIVKTLYSFETTDKSLSNIFLRFLEYAEAEIENFTYFSTTTEESEKVTHYLLTDGSGLSDDEMWSGYKKYVLLESLFEHDLMLFIPEDKEFFPSIKGLLCGTDSESFIIDEIKRKLLNNNENKENIYFLETKDNAKDISESQKGNENNTETETNTNTNWVVSELSNGKPLIEVIKIIIPNFDREKIRKVCNVEEFDFSKDNENLNQSWTKAADEETQKIISATKALSDDLLELSKDIETKMLETSDKLTAFQAMVNESTKTLKDLPPEFITFINNIEESINSVVKPREEWLNSINNEISSILFQIFDKDKIEIDLQKKLSDDKEKTLNVLEEFVQNKNKTNSAIDEAEQLSNTLSDRQEEIDSLNNELQKVFDQKQDMLTKKQQELDSLQEEIDKTDKILKQKEAELNEIQKELNEREEKQKQKSNELAEQEDEQIQKKEKLVQEALIIEQKITEIEKENSNLKELEITVPQLDENRLKILQSKNTLDITSEFYEYINNHNNELSSINNEISKLEKQTRSVKKSVFNNESEDSLDDITEFNNAYPAIIGRIKESLKNIEIAKQIFNNTKLIIDMKNLCETLESLQQANSKLYKNVNYVKNNGSTQEYLNKFKENIKEINNIRTKAAQNQNVQQKIAWWLVWCLGNL